MEVIFPVHSCAYATIAKFTIEKWNSFFRMSGMFQDLFYHLHIFEIQICASNIQYFICKHEGDQLGLNFFNTDILST